MFMMLGFLDLHKYQVALHLAGTAMLLLWVYRVWLHCSHAASLTQAAWHSKRRYWMICIWYLVNTDHYASEQHSILQGYRCLQNSVDICMHYLFRYSPRTPGSASCNAKPTWKMITCVLAFIPLESAPSSRPHTPGQTGSCRPGCPSQSIQQGCN